MALKKRSGIWWVDICHQGTRIRKSTGTQVKAQAQEFHDALKANLWRQVNFSDTPMKTWVEAVLRWLEESKHKRSIDDDRMHLRWLAPHMKNRMLHEINQDFIEQIAKMRDATLVAPATVNRMLEVVRAILRKAHRDWKWLDSVPTIRFRVVDNKRIRWLTHDEAARLLNELPIHLKEMAAFTLATGLRESNVTGLQWSDVDLVRRHAWVHPDQSKTKNAIAVPLNNDAIKILQRQMGNNPTHVFTFKGKPVVRCNNHAWRKALARAEIQSFRWHDLRHTWASWHVQNGTTLQELQLLGGWSNFEMVLRYAHLSSAHLQSAAERITVTNMSQPKLRVICGGR